MEVRECEHLGYNFGGEILKKVLLILFLVLGIALCIDCKPPSNTVQVVQATVEVYYH